MNNYDNSSREDLIKLIKRQEADLKSKTYGLVWDDEKEPEQVVLDCRDNLPILRRIKGKEIKEPKDNTQEDNILIEGDNYHALTVLNYTHQEKMDIICIDPPYNTGNANEWKYNDKYIDKNDGYRHSKWLSFMSKRLKLAKNILKESGLIFINIEKNEFAQLKLLCDSIFGENNFIENIIWRKKEGGGQQDDFFVTEHEYILVYAKRKSELVFIEKTVTRKTKYQHYNKEIKKRYNLTKLAKWGSAALKEDRPTMHFPLKNPDKNDTVPIAPDGRLGRWRYGKTNLSKLIDNNLIEWKKVKGDWVPYEICYEPDESDLQVLKQRSIFYDYATTRDGTNQLTQLFGKKDIFNNPKPTLLIQELLLLFCPSDGLILDFFAGSGTTGQATLELNELDNGNRKFILCTNNENNICTEVTHPRIEKVIKGYKNLKKESVEGLGGNLQYFKTSLIQTTKNRDQTKINLTQKCTEMFCLKENIFNVEIEEEDFKIFSSNKKDKFLCVYHNFIDESFESFINKLKELKGDKIVYMFSLEDKIDKSLFKEIKNCTLEAIPKKILEIYKKLIKMNIPIKAETIFIDLDKAKKQVFDDKDKDTGAKTLRVVLEKLVQKIAQKNQINILTDKGKEIKLSTLNDTLKTENLFSKLEWEENKTYLTIGNHASHGEYDEFDLTQVNKFYKHVQTLINKFNI